MSAVTAGEMTRVVEGAALGAAFALTFTLLAILALIHARGLVRAYKVAAVALALAVLVVTVGVL